MLRVLELALLHDFGEIHAGDITPSDAIARSDKLQRERDSFSKVLESWPDRRSLHCSSLTSTNEGNRAEAKFVRQLEKLEMALQAGVYQCQGLAIVDRVS